MGHVGYMVYVIIQACILLIIDFALDLPDNIIIFKPEYISLGVSLLLELYILYIVKRFVKVSTIKFKTMRDEEKAMKI